jgi:hypothetical protein
MPRVSCLLAATFSILAITTVAFGATADPGPKSSFALPKSVRQFAADSAGPIVVLAQGQLAAPRESTPSKEVNLLAPDQGGQALVIPNDEWFKPISGKEEDVATVYAGQEAVYAFRGEKAATFSKFSVLIVEQEGTNPKRIELLVADESPIAVFRSIGELDIVNAKMVKSPYQAVNLPETTARYFKIKILEGYQYGGLHLRQVRLTGRSPE